MSIYIFFIKSISFAYHINDANMDDNLEYNFLFLKHSFISEVFAVKTAQNNTLFQKHKSLKIK